MKISFTPYDGKGERIATILKRAIVKLILYKLVHKTTTEQKLSVGQKMSLKVNV